MNDGHLDGRRKSNFIGDLFQILLEKEDVNGGLSTVDGDWEKG